MGERGGQSQSGDVEMEILIDPARKQASKQPLSDCDDDEANLRLIVELPCRKSYASRATTHVSQKR